MPVTVQLIVDGESLGECLAQINGVCQDPVTETPPGPEPSKSRQPAKADAPAEEPTKAKPKSKAKPKTDKKDPPGETPIELRHLQALIGTFWESGGDEAGKKIQAALEAYEVEQLSDLKSTDYADLLTTLGLS